LKIKRALRVWQRHFTVYRKLYLSSIALNFVEPVLYLVAFGFGLGGYITEVEGRPYINFIAPGIIASSSMFATIYECTYGTYVRIFFQKTFDLLKVAYAGQVNAPGCEPEGGVRQEYIDKARALAESLA